MIRKLLAFLLCFSLLGQTALFAGTPPQTATPLTAVQKSAKEDLERNPGLKDDLPYLIALGLMGLALMQDWIFSTREISRLQDDLEKAIMDRDQNMADFLRRNNELDASYRQIEQLQNQVQDLRGRNRGLEAYSRRQAEQWNAFRSSTAEEAMKKYEKLFDRRVPEAERKALRLQLANEPWLKTATPAQQKEFLNIIDYASSQYIKEAPHAAHMNMGAALRASMKNHMPLFDHLVAIFKRVGSKNLPAIVLLATLGVASYSTANARDAKLADRISGNFNLFLNATPEELADIEQNEEARKVCIQGAEVLHQISLLPQEEIQKLLPSQSSSYWTGTSYNVNMAR